MRALTIILALVLAGPALAAIEWTWVNSGTGTEQGTLITDGVLVGDLAPAGTYTILDYTVTASAHGVLIGSVSDGTYVIEHPDQGFDWDGSAPTVFWRDSGQHTNGFWLWAAEYVPGTPNTVGLGIDWFLVCEDETVDYLYELLTPAITPVGTVTGGDTATFGGVKALYR